MLTDGAKCDSILIQYYRCWYWNKIFQQLIFTVYLEELTMNDSMIRTDAIMASPYRQEDFLQYAHPT